MLGSLFEIGKILSFSYQSGLDQIVKQKGLFWPDVMSDFPAFGGIKWFVNFLTGNFKGARWMPRLKVAMKDVALLR